MYDTIFGCYQRKPRIIKSKPRPIYAKKTIKPKYDSDVRSKDPNKLAVNNLLGKLAIGVKKIDAVVLDTNKLLTTKALIKAGFNKSNIHIPNPFDEKLIEVHTTTTPALLSDWLEEREGKVSFAFFDYMCSYDGNSDIKPEEDIKKFFQKRLPINNTVFAVTLSWRGKTKGGTYHDLNRLDALITSEANNNGYVAVKYPEGYSYNGMFFIVYNIQNKFRS